MFLTLHLSDIFVSLLDYNSVLLDNNEVSKVPFLHQDNLYTFTVSFTGYFKLDLMAEKMSGFFTMRLPFRSPWPFPYDLKGNGIGCVHLREWKVMCHFQLFGSLP